jgi:hypothetical protein
VETLARCRRSIRHPRCPEVSCVCGFYAVPADLRPAYTGLSFVQLDVELAGRVVIHQTGYRAEWQRVLGVRVDSCRVCGGPRSLCTAFDARFSSPWLLFCPCRRDALVNWAGEREAEWLLEQLPVPWTLEEGEGDV